MLAGVQAAVWVSRGQTLDVEVAADPALFLSLSMADSSPSPASGSPPSSSLRPGDAAVSAPSAPRIRKAFVMAVDPAKHEEYKARHDALWPDLHRALKDGGAHNYSIFLHPATSQLFAYVGATAVALDVAFDSGSAARSEPPSFPPSPSPFLPLSLRRQSAEIEGEDRWAAIARTDACQRWWAFMGDIMPHNADNSPVATELREVFHLP